MIYLNKLWTVLTPTSCSSTGKLRGLPSHKLFLGPFTWLVYNLNRLHQNALSSPAKKVTLVHWNYHAQLLWTLSPLSATVALPRKPYEPVMEPDSLLKSLLPQIMCGNESYLCTFLCEKQCLHINSIHPSRNVDSPHPHSIQAGSQHHLEIPADGSSAFHAGNASIVQGSAVQRSSS